MKPDYAELNNAKLVKSLEEDEDFYLNLVNSLQIKNIADLGCVTGLITCQLVKL